MSGLITQIASGTKALVAHTKNVEIAGKNLANVSNENYARQRVLMGDRAQIQTTIGTMSTGMEALGVEQLRDVYMDRQVMREIGVRAGIEAEQHTYDRAQAALDQYLNRADDSLTVGGTPQRIGGGMSEALTDFFASFESVSAKPTDVGERQLVVQKAEMLAEKINSADVRLAAVQEDLDNQIADGVSNINRILEEVARLNGQIGRSEIGKPDSAIDLRDQRQAQLEELAKYMNFEARTIPGGSGQIQVVAKDAGLGDVILVDKLSTTGPVSFDGTNLIGGSPATTMGITSGSIVALRGARDGEVQAMRDGLAGLANQLTTSVNAAYNPTGTTGDFFSTSPTGLIAVDPSVNANTLKTTDSTNPSANELALDVAKLANKRFSTANGDAIDGTPTEFLSKITGRIGQSLSSANTRLEDQKMLEKFVRDQRANVSGVSMDEELTDLLKFQRAFQASSRFVNVVDELLELVVTRLGN